MRTTAQLLALVTLLASAQQVVGCNSVLGIEQAELDEGGSCAFPWVEPTKECEGVNRNNCENCLSQCPGEAEAETACHKDSACRTALQNHRWCLNVDKDCSDERGTCAACLPASGPGKVIRDCLDICKGPCDGAGVYSLCSLYCACMGQKCQEQEFTLLDGSTTHDCATFCLESEPWRTSCRLSHCTRAPDMPDPLATTNHCRHSVSLDGFCQQQEVQEEHCVDPSDVTRAQNGHGCNEDDECCSGVCVNGGCVGVDL